MGTILFNPYKNLIKWKNKPSVKKCIGPFNMIKNRNSKLRNFFQSS